MILVRDVEDRQVREARRIGLAEERLELDKRRLKLLIARLNNMNENNEKRFENERRRLEPDATERHNASEERAKMIYLLLNISEKHARKGSNHLTY